MEGLLEAGRLRRRCRGCGGARDCSRRAADLSSHHQVFLPGVEGCHSSKRAQLAALRSPTALHNSVGCSTPNHSQSCTGRELLPLAGLPLAGLLPSPLGERRCVNVVTCCSRAGLWEAGAAPPCRCHRRLPTAHRHRPPCPPNCSSSPDSTPMGGAGMLMLGGLAGTAYDGSVWVTAASSVGLGALWRPMPPRSLHGLGWPSLAARPPARLPAHPANPAALSCCSGGHGRHRGPGRRAGGQARGVGGERALSHHSCASTCVPPRQPCIRPCLHPHRPRLRAPPRRRTCGCRGTRRRRRPAGASSRCRRAAAAAAGRRR